MIVTKKAISRRTVLRGVGAAVGLPLLDAMIPAFATAATTPATARRFGVVYHPNGVIYDKWLPNGTGANFEFSPTLAPLKAYRDQLIVVTNLFADEAEANGDGGGDHSRASGTYLTGVHIKKSDSQLENGISMDQIAGKAFERDTQLRSLEMIADDNSLVGDCDLGYSCAYSTTLSWMTPTLPLMAENNPRVLFERMFGASDSTDKRVRAARLSEDKSLLDSVNDRVSQLQKKLGRADNRKVDDYLTSLRVRLLYDLQLLAYQSDLTRVITFMYGREQTGRPYPQIGVPEPHHPVSHHQNNPAKMDKCAKIQRHHLMLFGEYLEKLRNTPDGDGSLLDHSILLFGGGISNSDRHTHGPLPTLLLGGSAMGSRAAVTWSTRNTRR
jgi:hypothetical protein